ncbi:MlaA family lipoprotein [Maridesulfovibrio bastinii]|uniref:MlaA family lipoprotein n=1 Tax=Maridesulfovibrio bastinii TaxID=47157 RepID=UPI000401F94F|nr:VacJ family lipoprotein [Maridesulfovibrio bastinii]
MSRLQNLSTSLLALLLMAFIMLSFPSRVRSEDEGTQDSYMVAQTGAAYLSANKQNAETDPFDEDLWGDSEHLKEAHADDPWESYNRAMFKFNDALYFNVLKPVTEGYKFVIPRRPRTWVNNFFNNLLYPVRFTGCVLQGKFFTAGAETSKFIVNTVFGLGGLGNLVGDESTTMPLYTGMEDMGQTFGVWGIPNGPYFVVPFLGPSTVRDFSGYAIDTFLLNPLWWFDVPWYYSLSAGAYNQINRLSFHIGEYESLKEGAIDPYLAMRNAYLSYRAKQVQDSKQYGRTVGNATKTK